MNHHISASKDCYEEWRKELVRNEQPSPKQRKENSSRRLMEGTDEGEVNTDIVDDFVMDFPPVERDAVEEDRHEGGNTYLTTNVDRFIESYPGDAGQAIEKSKTRFQEWFENQRNDQKIQWDPFASEEEWALCMWLIKNVGQKSTDEFLKLPIVSEISPFIKKKLNLRTFTRLIARRNYRSITRIHF